MPTRRALVAASTAQLAMQAAGLAVTLRRRLRYDFVPLGWRASADPTLGESLLMGTPFSAPGVMLAAQLGATAVLRRRASPAAARTLGLLGGGMIVGYLGERVVQRRLIGGWDPVETPVAAAGLAGAALMAALGLRRAVR
jgi:hypothetical protein